MVQTWRQRSRIKWDATQGSSGGAKRTAREAPQDVEGDGQGSSHVGGGLGYIIEKVQLKVVWSWAIHFGFPQSILGVLCGYFEVQRRVLSGSCVADLLKTVTAISQDSGDRSSCCALSCRTRWGITVCPQLDLKVDVDDMKVHVWGKNGDVFGSSGESKNVSMEKTSTEGGKEGRAGSLRPTSFS